MRKRIIFSILLVVMITMLAAPAFCWKFASFADSRGDTNGVNVAEMTTIVNRINAENVDLAIFQGDAVVGDPNDTTLGSMMNNWLSIMNTLNCPWYYCPGNHEIPASTSEAVLRTKVNQPMNGPAGHEEMVYSFDYQNAHFVSLNSDHYSEQHHVQRTWLASDLANTNQPLVLVMGHEPAYPTASHVGSSLDVYPSERDNLWNIFTNNGVGSYFCGHEHLFEITRRNGVYQCLNGSCGAPLVTGEPGTFGVYHYVICTVTGTSLHFEAKNDAGTLLTSWDYVVPAVTSPAVGSTVSTQTPPVTWSGGTHDAYQVKVTQRNDPVASAGNWDSGVVTSSASTVTTAPLVNYSVYYTYIKERNATTSWGPWSRKANDFVVNTTPASAVIYPADTLPAATGWTVFGGDSYENGGGVASSTVWESATNAWKIADASSTNLCTEKYSVTDVSFDTGATVIARMRATGTAGALGCNLGISNTGIGGMYLSLSTTGVSLVDGAGNVRGTYSTDGTAYHTYRLTVKNVTPGSDATALWKVSVDGTDRISWTGVGTDSGFDGFVAGHSGGSGTGTWYFDYIAGRSDGALTQAQWYPVDSDQPITAATPAEAKSMVDGAYVRLTANVTATYTDFFYVQDTSATPYCGIRVDKVSHGVSAGKTVTITGTMRTNSDDERYIDASDIVTLTDATAKQVAMPNHSIGGSELQYDPVTKAGQRGITGAPEANSIGMLIRTFGTVTYAGPDYFYMDDGSALNDNSGHAGVKVLTNGASVPTVNSYVDIKGIASCYKSGGSLYRQVRHVSGLPAPPSFVAYNDCIWPSGQSIGANVTTFGIGSGNGGPTTGHLIDQVTGADTGITVTLTQSGGVVWQPDPVSGGSAPNANTDAYNVFNGFVNIAGVTYYGSTGWWVDATFSGLQPAGNYVFETTANRNDASYTTRLSKYTISGVDSCVNFSTLGTTAAGASTTFCTGNNTVNGYVARWAAIKPGADGTFKVRAEVGDPPGDVQKAYAFSGFKLSRPKFNAYNDCVWEATQTIAANVTTFGIGAGYTGPTSGHLIDRATGADTGATITLTQNGGVNWQAVTTGGANTNVGTDAYSTFGGILDLRGVIFYAASAGWWVDAEFSNLDPTGVYEFATSANRNDGTYTTRKSKYTISGVDSFTNKSTTGVTIGDAGASTTFCSGYNTLTGYVARWINIRPGADGKFKVRAEVGDPPADAIKAYAFSGIQLTQVR